MNVLVDGGGDDVLHGAVVAQMDDLHSKGVADGGVVPAVNLVVIESIVYIAVLRIDEV